MVLRLALVLRQMLAHLAYAGARPGRSPNAVHQKAFLVALSASRTVLVAVALSEESPGWVESRTVEPDREEGEAMRTEQHDR
jgi:hypothetical protein